MNTAQKLLEKAFVHLSEKEDNKMASSILKVKKAKGAYSSDDGGLFATIGWNREANRFEARLYTWDGINLDCIKMAAHSKRLILAAKPILEMIK